MLKLYGIVLGWHGNRVLSQKIQWHDAWREDMFQTYVYVYIYICLIVMGHR